MEAPVVIEFVDGTTLEHDALVATGLPVVGNGPPGTWCSPTDTASTSPPSG